MAPDDVKKLNLYIYKYSNEMFNHKDYTTKTMIESLKDMSIAQHTPIRDLESLILCVNIELDNSDIEMISDIKLRNPQSKLVDQLINVIILTTRISEHGKNTYFELRLRDITVQSFNEILEETSTFRFPSITYQLLLIFKVWQYIPVYDVISNLSQIDCDHALFAPVLIVILYELRKSNIPFLEYINKSTKKKWTVILARYNSNILLNQLSEKANGRL